MKKRITTYTFDASEKTITFGFAPEIEGFSVITNVVDNVIIYQFNDPALGGSVTGNVLTLTYNTASMSDTDELMILYDDGVETQVVSGTVTAELSTTDNTVLDNIETAVEAIQAGQLPDGHNVTVDNVSLDVNTGLTQPLTDTELRATPVPVSGTFYQATQPVSGTVTANLSATDNAVLDDIASDTEAIKGSLATAGGLVVNLGANNDVTVTSGAITETNSGAIKTAVEKIDDAIAGSEMQVDVVSMPTTTVQATNLDIRDLSQATDGVAIYGSDDGGTTKRLIKTDAGGAIQVDLEVSSVTVDNVTIDNEGGASAVNVQDGGNSLTVDGAVTANAGTNLNTSALALESGGNLASIKTNTDKIPAQGQALAAASLPVVLPAAQITALTPPAAITGFATSAKQDTLIGHVDGIEGSVDGIEALLTTIEGNQLPDGHNVTVDNASIAVTGTVTANTGLSQPLTDTQLRATAVPVSGTVTANLGATDNAVLDDIASDTEAIKTSLAGTLTVTGGGGGVEYTEGDTDATITGGAVMMEGADNTLVPIQGTVADGLLVNLGSNNYVTVTSGSVTANAGTNLNTSALALETGGNLASIKTNTDKIPALGQALAAGSVPVVLTAAQLSTLTPPAAITGFATSAKQDTIIGHVDGIETVLGTIDTDTGNMATSLGVLDNAISGSEMQVDVVAPLPAGTNAIGKLAANSGVDIGDVDVLSLPDSGQSIFRSIDLDESEEAVKASAGTVYGWYLYNNSSATLYMKLYNATVANVTVGTTTPVMTIPVPAGSAANVSFNGGITFGTAITAAVTTGVADNNTGAPAANDFIANIFYK